MKSVPGVDRISGILPVARRDPVHAPVNRDHERGRNPNPDAPRQQRPDRPERSTVRDETGIDDLAPSATIGHIVNTFAMPTWVHGDSRLPETLRGLAGSERLAGAHDARHARWGLRAPFRLASPLCAGD